MGLMEKVAAFLGVDQHEARSMLADAKESPQAKAADAAWKSWTSGQPPKDSTERMWHDAFNREHPAEYDREKEASD